MPHRLPGYDYAEPGWYFVTVCLDDRRELLGAVSSASGLYLNPVGRMIARTLIDIPRKYSGVALDESIVMPDHVHLIVFIGTDPHTATSTSLFDLMRWFKSVSTKRYGEGVRERGWAPYGRPLWQRHYYDRVIRTDRELNQIRRYIAENPARWIEKRS